MYLRWHRVETVRWRSNADPVRRIRQRAILVENIRIDGKSRSKHVAFIASYEATTPDDIERTRADFWSKARGRLDQLLGSRRITAQDRSMIEAALAKRMTPTPEDEALPPTKAEAWEIDLKRAVAEISPKRSVEVSPQREVEDWEIDLKREVERSMGVRSDA